MKTYSIITPCYNATTFIASTLQSALAQTVRPVEIIVVDDGSTDDSAEIVRSFPPPVRLVQQANQGESVARNCGINLAKGDYLFFLDADDLLKPDAVERLLSAVASRPDAVGLMGFEFFTDDPTRLSGASTPDLDAFFPAVLQRNPGPIHCWLTPRSLALRLGGFRQDLKYSEDWEFWGRVALEDVPLVSIPYCGALYRKHARSQVETAPRPAVMKGRLVVVESLGRSVLSKPRLFERVAVPLFWSLWALWTQARSAGVPAADLTETETLIQEVARRMSGPVSRSMFVRMTAWLGLRRAERLRGLVSAGRPTSPEVSAR